MKQIRLYLLLLTLVISACKKDRGTESIDPNQLPPATETGANILACKVNGKVQVYSGVPITMAENGVSFTKYYEDADNQFVKISASNNKYGDHINITLYETNWSIQINKTYQFSKEQKIKGHYFLQNTIDEYYTDLPNGSVIFTQYNDKVVAGKFYFKAYKQGISDSVNITEGFFDIAVKP